MVLLSQAVLLSLSVAALAIAVPTKREEGCTRRSSSPTRHSTVSSGGKTDSSVEGKIASPPLANTSVTLADPPDSSAGSKIASPALANTSVTLVQAASTVLPHSFVNPQFLQSRKTITAYGVKSVQALLDESSPSTGALIPGGTWASQIGFQSIANWDYLHGTKDFYDPVSQGQAASARPNGQYGVPLADQWNDDNMWAGMASLKAYQAYGDDVFMTRAQGIWQVSSVFRGRE